MKKKILYIEDDKKLAEIYEQSFTTEGFETKWCKNAEDGLRDTLKFHPDLIITEIMMPNISGYDVIDILQNTDETKEIPIVVLTNLQQSSDIVKAIKLGASDYIIKSQVVIADVVNRVKEQLGIEVNDEIQEEKEITKMLKDITNSKPALFARFKDKWEYPSRKLIKKIDVRADAGDPHYIANVIEKTLAEFDIEVRTTEANIGAQYTRYVVAVERGEIPKKILQLDDVLSIALSSHPVNIELSVLDYHEAYVDVPNKKSSSVSLRKIVDSKEYSIIPKLAFALGLNVSGKTEFCDIYKAPHILLAGQTGSGKSMMFDNILLNLLLKNSPSELRLILIDPKMVQFTPYDDIPHLITPVIRNPDIAASAIIWTIAEMERRYKLLSYKQKSNIDDLNKSIETKLPKILILCDEVADLMMVSGEFFESSFVRLMQKSRAVGIHIILGTSRPSSDVLTGMLLANAPTRIAFTTTSSIDSETILDQSGAERLLGRGDLLYRNADIRKPLRLQAPYVDEEDVLNITNFIKKKHPTVYIDSIIEDAKKQVQEHDQEAKVIDDLYLKVLKYVVNKQKASTAMFQRKFQIGYGRAAMLMEMLEENGVVGPADGTSPREVYRSEY